MALVGAGGCDSTPPDGAFTCIASEGYVCPAGQSCDIASGLCYRHAPEDMAITDATITFDFTAQPLMRTCDQLVQQGAFSNLTNLGAVNSAGDEHSLALSLDGTQIYFLDGSGALQTSKLSADGHHAPAATAVTLTGAPTTLNGGSLATDGSYWFSGTNAGVTSLFQATKQSVSSFTVGAAQLPMQGPPTNQSSCAFTDPALTDGDSKLDLYVAFPLAGCSQPSMIAQGFVGKTLGTFVGTVAPQGFQAPGVVKGGLTVLMSNTGSGARLYYAQRPSTDVTFTGPTPLPLGAIGAPSGRDVQAVVNQSCSLLYLVAERAGGHGGLDLWAADIAPQ